MKYVGRTIGLWSDCASIKCMLTFQNGSSKMQGLFICCFFPSRHIDHSKWSQRWGCGQWQIRREEIKTWRQTQAEGLSTNQLFKWSLLHMVWQICQMGMEEKLKRIHQARLGIGWRFQASSIQVHYHLMAPEKSQSNPEKDWRLSSGSKLLRTSWTIEKKISGVRKDIQPVLDQNWSSIRKARVFFAKVHTRFKVRRPFWKGRTFSQATWTFLKCHYDPQGQKHSWEMGFLCQIPNTNAKNGLCDHGTGP